MGPGLPSARVPGACGTRATEHLRREGVGEETRQRNAGAGMITIKQITVHDIK